LVFVFDEILSLYIQEKGQDEIARKLRISQPAVQTRLERAGHFAVKETLDLFAVTVKESIIKSGVYDPRI
jgi:DNA-binding transcriptional regulator LsrR (DeoR family)